MSRSGEFEWVSIESGRRLIEGMFVAQVVGKSMEPTIPDGAYCLFRAPVTGTRQGKTVLVQLRETVDPGTGERYTVKRHRSEKAVVAEDSWRHERITLVPPEHGLRADRAGRRRRGRCPSDRGVCRGGGSEGTDA